MKQLQKKEGTVKVGFQDSLPEIPPGNPPKEHPPVKDPPQKKPPNEAPPRRDPPKEKPPLEDPPVKEPLFRSRRRDRPSGQEVWKIKIHRFACQYT